MLVTLVPWPNNTNLIHIHTQFSQVHLGEVDFLHELLVCGRNIIESEDAVTEAEEEEGSKRDEGPKRELCVC
jgi:hypothetical protein